MRNIRIFCILIVILLVYIFTPTFPTTIAKTIDTDDIINQPMYRETLYSIINESNKSGDFILAIIGTDERNDEKSRSDVIILVKYKSEENKVIVVSVPRDSKVYIPNKGLNKVNAATAFGGAKLLVDILEDMFKISNVRFIHFNFEGFKSIVDALGGIEINVQEDFKRDWGDKHIYLKKGKNILFGEDLLDYVRFRHDNEGDFGRIKRQQEVIKSLSSSALNTKNLSKLPEIALLIAKNSESDMDIFFIMKYIEQITMLKSLKYEFYTLKTSSEFSKDIWYEIIDEEHLKHLSGLLHE